VTKALGTRSTVEPDIRLEDVVAGDVFILCSDGLSDAVQPSEIARIIEKAGDDRRVAIRSLIHLANKRGGRDNITVVLAEVVNAQSQDDDEDMSETTEIIVPSTMKQQKASGIRKASSS
jgi:protein phosphatase